MLRRTALIFLLLIGLVGGLSLRGPAGITPLQGALLIVSLIVVFIRPLAGPLENLLSRWRHPTPRQRAIATAVLFILATLYLIFTAFRQQRELYPRFHDDQAYLLQLRLLSCGHLWTAPHALPDFFDTFYVLVTPVYASIYFPGTAILYVLEIWLHAPIWLGPMIASGLVIALMFRIATELLDDAVLGMVAAFFVLGVAWFRYLSTVVMSHTALMLLGLAAILAFLRWRSRPTFSRAIIFGALAGWAAITRPLDAVCYILPSALAMLWQMRHMNRRLAIRTLGVVALSAAPFLAAQLFFDKGVTGHFLKSPYTWYSEIYDPNLAYGAHVYDPTLLPHTVVLQKKIYDQYFVAPMIADAAANSPITSWWNWKFRKLMVYSLPRGAMAILLPVGLLAIRSRKTWPLWGIAPMFLGAYAFFAFLLPQYCVLASPAFAILAMMGIDVLRREFPRLGSRIDLFLTLAAACLALFSLTEFTGDRDDFRSTPTMHAVAVDMPQIVHAPAVVLFRFNPHDDYIQEPVYNLDACNIDDAPVIRAHDLGPQRNPEIFDYYAKRQPDRMFYLFDRHSSQITPMGTARELAAKYPLIPAS